MSPHNYRINQGIQVSDKYIYIEKVLSTSTQGHLYTKDFVATTKGITTHLCFVFALTRYSLLYLSLKGPVV